MAVARLLRHLVPSAPVLTRWRALFLPLDLVDWLLRRAFHELADVPPARLRIRTGLGSRPVFNQLEFKYAFDSFWKHAFLAGWAGVDSSILELGSGCGRVTAGLKNFDWHGHRYSGSYTGLDVDEELVAWCRANYPPNYRFLTLDVHSSVYNPRGGRNPGVEFPIRSESQDFVFAVSLFTHLLEDHLTTYLRECHRVMRPGTRLVASFFCIDHLAGQLGGRWTFPHRLGAAHVESLRYPEAAVAYSEEYILDAYRSAGFAIDLKLHHTQSLAVATRSP
jgi:SAM-dependent methyltransferase